MRRDHHAIALEELRGAGWGVRRKDTGSVVYGPFRTRAPAQGIVTKNKSRLEVVLLFAASEVVDD